MQMHVWKPKGERARPGRVALTTQCLEQDQGWHRVPADPKFRNLRQSTTFTANMLALCLDPRVFQTIHLYISQRLVPDTGLEALSVLSSKLVSELYDPLMLSLCKRPSFSLTLPTILRVERTLGGPLMSFAGISSQSHAGALYGVRIISQRDVVLLLEVIMNLYNAPFGTNACCVKHETPSRSIRAGV